jgi:hypothetical protein
MMSRIAVIVAWLVMIGALVLAAVGCTSSPPREVSLAERIRWDRAEAAGVLVETQDVPSGVRTTWPSSSTSRARGPRD